MVDFPGDSVVKNPPADARDTEDAGAGPSLGQEGPLWEEMVTHPLQYSCLENPINKAAWWATVHGVAKSQI